MRTITALFADLKGSTELMHGLDREEARAFVDALRVMIVAVRCHYSYIVQSTGDGLAPALVRPASC